MSGHKATGEQDTQRQPHPAASTTERKGSAADRVGTQGGDDGALEHEQTEGATPVTSLAEDAVSKVKPGR